MLDGVDPGLRAALESPLPRDARSIRTLVGRGVRGYLMFLGFVNLVLVVPVGLAILEPNQAMDFLCGGGCLVGVMIVLPSTAFVLFNVAKMWRLGKNGVVLSGRVVTSTRAGQPGQRVARLVVATVLPDDGREIRFEVSGMVPAWAEGTQVPVLVDPGKARTPAVIVPGTGLVLGRRR